jgi:hypothetical protein
VEGPDTKFPIDWKTIGMGVGLIALLVLVLLPTPLLLMKI